MKPEDYWLQYGDNVVGTDVLEAKDKARQAPTYQAIARWIIAHDVQDALDVGCNVAALAMFLRKHGYVQRYLGIDHNPHALIIATDYEKVESGNLRHLAFKDKTFDCVVVKDIVEHLESYKPLREAFRVSSRYVIVGTYLPWTDEPAHIAKHPDGYYANRYRQSDVLKLAAKCGFKMIEQLGIDETSGWPNQVTYFERSTI